MVPVELTKFLVRGSPVDLILRSWLPWQESPEEMRAEMAELAAMYETINIEQVIASSYRTVSNRLLPLETINIEQVISSSYRTGYSNLILALL